MTKGPIYLPRHNWPELVLNMSVSIIAGSLTFGFMWLGILVALCFQTPR